MSDAASSGPPIASWRVPLVIGGTCLAALGMAWLGWRVDGGPRDLVAMTVLGAMLVASWAVRVEVLGKVSVGSASIISLASFVLVGPLGSALINAASMLLEFGQKQLRVRAFNAAMAALLGAFGSLAYLWSGGDRDPGRLDGAGALLVRVGGPLMLANVAQSLLNLALVAGIVWASTGQSYRRYFRSMLTTSGLSQTGFGVIGFLFVILWVPARVGPVSAVLILLPLFVARWAYIQYGDEQRAQERALAALVAAAETGDRFATGHSRRVAELAEWVGEELGAGSLAGLRYAAMLHDIGMVAAPTIGLSEAADRRITADALTIATDPRAVAAVIGHPERGVVLLADVAFLQDALPAIRHHHERWDGTGFPDGLAGERIPLGARIIAAADAFDSLTRVRPAQPALPVGAALRVLDARAGTHLDPAVVAAVTRVLQRHRWEPLDDLPAGARHTLLAVHDDPQVSDTIARWRPAGVAPGLGPGR